MLEWAFSSGVLVILVLLIRQLFKGRISLRLQYSLWLLVLARLLVPVNLFDTDVSALNLLALQSEAETPQIRTAQGAVGSDLNGGAALPQNGGQEIDMTNPSYGENSGYKELSAAKKEDMAHHGDEAVKKTAWLSRLLWVVWIVGVIAAAAVLGGANLHFAHRLRQARRPLTYKSEKGLLIYVVRGLPSPCLFGLIHPAIYLPEEITEEELFYILAHEESHYRTGDHIWSLLRSLCLALHWYHPLVWLAAFVSRQDSELACDERTVRCLGEECRKAYGRVLVDLTVKNASAADFLCCATTMTADGRSLKERVQLISHKPHMLATTGGMVAALIVAVFCVACTGAKEDVKSEPDAMGSDALENREDDTTGTSAGDEGEKSPENADYIFSDNAYYYEVKDTLIDDPYFSMEIPEELVGKVAYGVVLGENAEGNKYLQELTFFHIDSMTLEDSPAIDGQQRVPECTWREIYWYGALCSYIWTGYLDMEEELEEIAYRSGTWDIREMEFILANDYDGYAGIGGRLVQANEAGTGAYFYVEPTDVQFDPENPEEYMTCAGELAKCRYQFTAKSFPYEEVEGYPKGNYPDIPQWRQDFEAAERAYSWFTDAGQVPMRALTSSDMGSRPYEAFDGLLYGVVDVPGIENMEELRSYLNRYFAPEIVEGLMSGKRPTIGGKGDIPPFVEENGILYAAEGAITENDYSLNSRQYIAYFTGASETGQEQSGENTEGGGRRRRAKIYMNGQYNTIGADIQAVLCYTMEEQEDGSWRIIEDFELPAHVLMCTVGYYSAKADRAEAFLVQ